jgi:hypothetical protein
MVAFSILATDGVDPVTEAPPAHVMTPKFNRIAE